jgi:hypothetical protein
VIQIDFGKVKRRRKDEALYPEREPRIELDKMRVEIGEYVFSAQCQQESTPPGGNRLRCEWFGTYSEALSRHDFQWLATVLWIGILGWLAASALKTAFTRLWSSVGSAAANHSASGKGRGQLP